MWLYLARTLRAARIVRRKWLGGRAAGRPGSWAAAGRAAGAVCRHVDAVPARAAVTVAPRLVSRQIYEDRLAVRRRASADPAALAGDDELREAHRAVRGDPVGKGRGCPGHVDVRRPAIVGDDLRHGSGLGEQGVEVANRRRLIAGLARDNYGVQS